MNNLERLDFYDRMARIAGSDKEIWPVIKLK
jgi:hypothetical protein